MSLIKQQWGDFWAIGGNPKEMIPLSLSLHNWGAISLAAKDNDNYDPLTDTEDYLNLGNPSEFVYILVNEERYIRARAKSFVNHWEFKFNRNSGKLSWGLAILRAKNELSKIKTYKFMNTNIPDFEFYERAV